MPSLSQSIEINPPLENVIPVEGKLTMRPVYHLRGTIEDRFLDPVLGAAVFIDARLAQAVGLHLTEIPFIILNRKARRLWWHTQVQANVIRPACRRVCPSERCP